MQNFGCTLLHINFFKKGILKDLFLAVPQQNIVT